MKGFSTKNSNYEFDTKRKIVKGGILGNKGLKYLKISIEVGGNAVIYLDGGKVLETSEVLDWF